MWLFPPPHLHENTGENQVSAASALVQPQVSPCSITHLCREEHLRGTLPSTPTHLDPSSYHGSSLFSCGNSPPWPMARPNVFNGKFQQPKLDLKASRVLHTQPANQPHQQTHTCTNETTSGISRDIAEKSFEMPFGILLTQGRFPPVDSSSTCNSTVSWRPAPTACLAAHQNKSPAQKHLCATKLQHKQASLAPRYIPSNGTIKQTIPDCSKIHLKHQPNCMSNQGHQVKPSKQAAVLTGLESWLGAGSCRLQGLARCFLCSQSVRKAQMRGSLGSLSILPSPSAWPSAAHRHPREPDGADAGG